MSCTGPPHLTAQAARDLTNHRFTMIIDSAIHLAISKGEYSVNLSNVMACSGLSMPPPEIMNLILQAYTNEGYILEMNQDQMMLRWN